jgi:hypothetical protein
MLIITALKIQSQEDCKFEASLKKKKEIVKQTDMELWGKGGEREDRGEMPVLGREAVEMSKHPRKRYHFPQGQTHDLLEAC